MKKNKPSILLLLLLFLGAMMPPSTAQAAPSTLWADTICMDDEGRLLTDFYRERYAIEKGVFQFHAAPHRSGYRFVTCNILELVGPKGSSYRVNYFYEKGEGAAEALPQGQPMKEMPKKPWNAKNRTVYVSWVDERGHALRPSKLQTVAFAWDAYEVPKAPHINGYGVTSLEKGRHLFGQKSVPHLIYCYGKNQASKTLPSLVYEKAFRELPRRIVEPAVTPKMMVPSETKKTVPMKNSKPAPGKSAQEPRKEPEQQISPSGEGEKPFEPEGGPLEAILKEEARSRELPAPETPWIKNDSSQDLIFPVNSEPSQAAAVNPPVKRETLFAGFALVSVGILAGFALRRNR
ncbi:hypothetical protein ABB02_01134 [Clostridiaceae bacterium JG1575]|nr:hypothetical protein ABB02_01134 [Clostridiaceae bacterium JG1575]